MPHFTCPVYTCENHDGCDCKLKNIYMEMIDSSNTEAVVCCFFEYKKETYENQIESNRGSMKISEELRKDIWNWLCDTEREVSELKTIVQNEMDIDMTMYKDWERAVNEVITELTNMKFTMYDAINYHLKEKL